MIEIAPDLMEALQAEADRQGVSVSEIADQAIRAWIGIPRHRNGTVFVTRRKGDPAQLAAAIDRLREGRGKPSGGETVAEVLEAVRYGRFKGLKKSKGKGK